MASVTVTTSPTTLDAAASTRLMNISNTGPTFVTLSSGAKVGPGQARQVLVTAGTALTATTGAGTAVVTVDPTPVSTPTAPPAGTPQESGAVASVAGLTGAVTGPDLSTAMGLPSTYAAKDADWATGLVCIVGQVVANSGSLYRCKTAHTAGVSFDASKFDAISGGSGAVSSVVGQTGAVTGTQILADTTVAGALTAKADASAVTTALAGKANTTDLHAGPIYGPGSDGAVTISTNTTLSADMYYSALTVNNGITLTMAGYRVFVAGTLTLNGTISNSATSNTAPAAASIGGGKNGSAGGTGVGTIANADTGIGNFHGGSGGAAGAGSSGAGGAAQSNVAWAANKGGVATLANPTNAMAGMLVTNAAPSIIGGGAGGASGAGDGTNSGAAGGGGGGVVEVVAARLAGAGTIAATGAAGRNATTGNCGGGGGGGGGVVVLMSSATTNPYTLDVSAGAGGNGTGTGVNGSSGGAGRTFVHLGV